MTDDADATAQRSAHQLRRHPSIGNMFGPILIFKKAMILQTRSGVGCMGLFGGNAEMDILWN